MIAYDIVPQIPTSCLAYQRTVLAIRCAHLNAMRVSQYNIYKCTQLITPSESTEVYPPLNAANMVDARNSTE